MSGARIAGERAAPEVVCIGEPLVALVGRELGPLHAIDTFSAHVTGAELNVAVGLARQGVPVSFVGRCGDDAFGERIARTLRAERVDTAHLQVDPEAPTGMLVRNLRPFGGSEVLYARAGAAGVRLDEDDIRAAADDILAARFIHLTGITTALSPASRRAARSAIAIAREAGTAVSVDVNLRGRLCDVETQREVLRPVIAAADLVFCGEDEGVLLTGACQGPEIAHHLQEWGADRVVIKQGADGATAFRAGRREADCPARHVVPIDLVGAGDAFAAGCLAALLQDLDLATALRAAATTAAYAITARGDIEGLPDRHELATAMEADAPHTVR